MHGRIYVEKNIGLQKERQKTLQLHYKNLERIKKGQYNLKELLKSSDSQLKYRNKFLEMNREFKDNGR